MGDILNQVRDFIKDPSFTVIIKFIANVLLEKSADYVNKLLDQKLKERNAPLTYITPASV